MDGQDWNWALLNRDQLEMLREGERTLGADILLAYRKEPSGMGGVSLKNLKVAELDESQLECLQGLEENLETVVVAYQSS